MKNNDKILDAISYKKFACPFNELSHDAARERVMNAAKTIGKCEYCGAEHGFGVYTCESCGSTELYNIDKIDEGIVINGNNNMTFQSNDNNDNNSMTITGNGNVSFQGGNFKGNITIG